MVDVIRQWNPPTWGPNAKKYFTEKIVNPEFQALYDDLNFARKEFLFKSLNEILINDLIKIIVKYAQQEMDENMKPVSHIYRELS